MQTMQTIGFIGASGLMGHGIAKNLRAKGHTIKLLNNFIGQAICTATAEAFAVGQGAGVDLHKLVELVSAGAVNSRLFQAMAKTLNGDLAGLKFELDNARKDLRYCTHLAESLNVPALAEAQVQLNRTKIVAR
jgi:3-hydroxyisobutyrate dehydrogenase-like beta-hydroxyacid dehydrogenase